MRWVVRSAPEQAQIQKCALEPNSGVQNYSDFPE